LAEVCFEIQIAPTVALSAPYDGAAPDLAAANPEKRLVRFRDVGVLLVVDEELAVPLVEPTTSGLDGLLLGQPTAVAHAAEFHLPLRYMLNIVLFGSNRTTSLENKCLETLFGKFFCSPTPGDS